MPSYPHLTPSAAPTPDASPTKEGALEAAAEEEEAPPSASTAGAAEALAAKMYNRLADSTTMTKAQAAIVNTKKGDTSVGGRGRNGCLCGESGEGRDTV